MFAFAVLTIIYSYIIFAFGMIHLIYPISLSIVSIFYIVSLFFIFRRGNLPRHPKLDVISKIVFSLLVLLGMINLIGALGPETSFDALWYHLTFPKLYLTDHSIKYISGGLLYYSVMPKLGEMLFTPAIFFSTETGAKLFQFLFGILTTIVVYQIARKYLSMPASLLACLIFYSNIVVSWESTVAYIDLIRAFFEILALYAFLLWYEKKKYIWLILCAVMVGTAMSTKILALGSLGIFIIFILLVNWKKKLYKKTFLEILWFTAISILMVTPWLVFAYISTGNPFYPFFTDIYKTGVDTGLFTIQTAIFDVIKLFLFSDDPISPIYLIMLPLCIFYFKKLSFPAKIIGMYCLGAFIFWYITPRTGGGRFILPYLPAWSVFTVFTLQQIKEKIIYRSVSVAIILISLVTIGYRGVANVRYFPVIIGKESKEVFLRDHLNFSFGDFYDTDRYFAQHIKPTDKVLLYGFHNLYYVDFPFIDSSFVKPGDTFTYIATQNTPLPERFRDWKPVYKNPKTSVTLYKKGEKPCQY